MEYTVVVHQAEEGGFWVEVPALPGCYSQGESVEDALENVMEAISLYLETLKEEGREAPQDTDVIHQVRVAV
jgi:predicted RNase H-like HicB family nuclease